MLGNKRLLIGLTGLLAIGLLAGCNAQPEQVTRVVEVVEEVTTQVEATRLIIEEREVEVTRLVQVTPTPTPIPTGGFVNTVIAEDAVNLNPLLALDDASKFVSDFLFGSMLRSDPSTGELVCFFCESWQLVDRTLTFVLRDDISWSDGELVTADDFVYTYAALLWGVANESLDASFEDEAMEIESVAKIDDQTAAVTMAVDNCDTMRNLNVGWLPQHLYGPNWQYENPITLAGQLGDPDDPDFAGIASSEMNLSPAVSNGPFLFEEWVPGDHLTLVRNPAYFRGVPYVEGLVVRIEGDEDARVQMLRTGQVDLLEGIPPRLLTQVELMDQLAVHKVLEDSYVYLGMQFGNPDDPEPRWVEDPNTGQMLINESHGEHPILSDVRVRQAIAYGIDRDAIINQVVVGQGVPLYGNMLPSLEWAHDGSLAPRAYNPNRAAALLDEAGWILNEDTGLRAKEGVPLRLDLKTNVSSDKRVQISEIIQEQLGQIGFQIEFEAMQWGAFVGVLLGQQYDLVVISWTNLGDSPDDSQFYRSEQDVPGRGFNFVSYYNPVLDDLWQNAATLPGCRLSDRAVVYRQIQQTLYEELPYNWLYVPLSLVGANKQIVGVDPGPWGTWHNVEAWYLRSQ